LSEQSGKMWRPEEDAQLRDLVASGARPLEVAEQLGRTKRAILTRAFELRVKFGRPRPKRSIKVKRAYVFAYYLFTSRRGTPPKPWFWEIRSKSNPDQRTVSAGGFKSAKAAEDAGRLILSQIRDVLADDRRQSSIDKNQERRSKVARKLLEAAIANADKDTITPERRSEIARAAALARAQVLKAERRSEIGRMGGAASKGKAKLKRLAKSALS
jgi:hypothetical protein